MDRYGAENQNQNFGREVFAEKARFQMAVIRSVADSLGLRPKGTVWKPQFSFVSGGVPTVVSNLVSNTESNTYNTHTSLSSSVQESSLQEPYELGQEPAVLADYIDEPELTL